MGIFEKMIVSGISPIKKGLINNPDICIKSLNSTFACVCKDCRYEYKMKIQEYLKELETKTPRGE